MDHNVIVISINLSLEWGDSFDSIPFKYPWIRTAKPVADPGFPRGGANSWKRCTNLLFRKVFAMKMMKEFGPTGGTRPWRLSFGSAAHAPLPPPPPGIKQKVKNRPKESKNSKFLNKKLFCRLPLSPQPLWDSIRTRFSDERDLFVWGKCQNKSENLYLQKQRVEVQFYKRKSPDKTLIKSQRLVFYVSYVGGDCDVVLERRMSLPDSGCDGEAGVFSSVQDTAGPEHTGKGSLTLIESDCRVFLSIFVVTKRKLIKNPNSHV